MDGIINVYKEKGYTSHDVVAKMRGILRMRKIGHTGTLDPDAEGVLPVCLGKGTKLCNMLVEHTKTYQAVMLLGKETDTQDISGATLASLPVHVTEGQVVEAIRSFLGEYMQVPPMYSAQKVNGKRLYELARAGKEVERRPRLVEILEIRVDRVFLPRVAMTVSCSKGTYIRTLCHDIGRTLGCGACMESLLRTRVGRFCVEESLRLGEIEALWATGDIGGHILGLSEVFSDLPGLMALPGGEADKLLHNGNPFGPQFVSLLPGWGGGIKTHAGPFPAARVYDSGGRFIGVYGYDPDKRRYQPQKIFLGGD